MKSDTTYVFVKKMFKKSKVSFHVEFYVLRKQRIESDTVNALKFI